MHTEEFADQWCTLVLLVMIEFTQDLMRLKKDVLKEMVLQLGLKGAPSPFCSCGV